MKIILPLMLSVCSFAVSGCISSSTSYWKANSTDIERDQQYASCLALSLQKFPKKIAPTGEATTECFSISSSIKCIVKPLWGDVNAAPRLEHVQSCMESQGFIKRY